MQAKNAKGARPVKRRTEVKELPKKRKELTKGEQQKVKGGTKPQQEVPYLIRIIE